MANDDIFGLRKKKGAEEAPEVETKKKRRMPVFGLEEVKPTDEKEE